MASVLFCWELGAGFGHLTPHREVLATLQQKGHTVHVAVRDLVRATKAFEGQRFAFSTTSGLSIKGMPLNDPLLVSAVNMAIGQGVHNDVSGVLTCCQRD